jgi:hypothetical protein
LANRLTHVQPEIRKQLSQVVTGVARRASVLESQAGPASKKDDAPPQVAIERSDDK